MTPRIEKSEQEWRSELTPAQCDVLRRKGTEPPFSGGYVHTKEDGVYRCAGCGTDLFSSDTKFDSGTGWPSFTDPAASANIGLHEDRSLFTRRTEVTCATCGGHLGHDRDARACPGRRPASRYDRSRSVGTQGRTRALGCGSRARVALRRKPRRTSRVDRRLRRRTLRATPCRPRTRRAPSGKVRRSRSDVTSATRLPPRRHLVLSAV